jgi:hypothetical protein
VVKWTFAAGGVAERPLHYVIASSNGRWRLGA